MRYLCVLALFLGGCLIPQSAYQLAGYTTPGVEIRKKDGNWQFKADSNFKGNSEVEVQPDGAYKFKIKMTSDAEGVTTAQGERARDLEALREIEAQRIIAQSQMLRDAIHDVIGAVVTLAPMLKPTPTPEPQPLPIPIGPLP